MECVRGVLENVHFLPRDNLLHALTVFQQTKLSYMFLSYNQNSWNKLATIQQGKKGLEFKLRTNDTRYQEIKEKREIKSIYYVTVNLLFCVIVMLISVTSMPDICGSRSWLTFKVL